jgi:endonuclease/exonuclease/phosphatase family metal-dependent hydrolase
MSWNPLQLFMKPSTPPITAKQVPLQLRVISHNIRYATSAPFSNERPWPERAPHLLNQLQHELRPISLSPVSDAGVAAFVCLQEVLHKQLLYILAGLNHLEDYKGSDPPAGPLWAHIGVGRDDGKTKGEYSPILYPVKLFKLLHEEKVWLSPTPDRPSKGWDASSIRILTVGVFEHIGSSRRLIAANTHLDDAGSKSRKESVGVILRTLKRIHSEWAQDGELAIFLAGDFNSIPTQEAYLAIKESGYLKDTHDEVDVKDRYGNSNTFTGFEPDKGKDDQKRIDFVWLGPAAEKVPSGMAETPWDVEGYAVLPNVFDAGVYLSDHRAVVGDVQLR